jgi:Auxiliary Activity family 9 (formerly GH61)
MNHPSPWLAGTSKHRIVDLLPTTIIQISSVIGLLLQRPPTYAYRMARLSSLCGALWPAHQGPVITYFAACNGPCENANKSELTFFKIDELGLLNETGSRNSGYWVMDDLIANNNSWSVTVPQNLRFGAYILRHEVINLNNGGGKAQHYPQCITYISGSPPKWEITTPISPCIVVSPNQRFDRCQLLATN